MVLGPPFSVSRKNHMAFATNCSEPRDRPGFPQGCLCAKDKAGAVSELPACGTRRVGARGNVAPGAPERRREKLAIGGHTAVVRRTRAPARQRWWQLTAKCIGVAAAGSPAKAADADALGDIVRALGAPSNISARELLGLADDVRVAATIRTRVCPLNLFVGEATDLH